MKRRGQSTILQDHIHTYASIYVFVSILFLMGVLFGAFMVNNLSLVQKEDLFTYLTQFFGDMTEGNIASSQELFQQSFFHNNKFLGIMWILGISIIGLPILFILLFLKGVVVGFSVGFLVNQMKWNGFLLSFVSVLPQNLLIIPLFIFVTVMATSFSLMLIRTIFIKQRTSQPIGPWIVRYVGVLILAIGVITCSSGIEAYISPYLMKIVLLTSP